METMRVDVTLIVEAIELLRGFAEKDERLAGHLKTFHCGCR